MKYYKNDLTKDNDDIKISENLRVSDNFGSLEISDTPEPQTLMNVTPEDNIGQQFDNIFVTNSELLSYQKQSDVQNDQDQIFQDDLFRLTQNSISEIEGKFILRIIFIDVMSNGNRSQTIIINNSEHNMNSTTSVKLFWENKTITECEDEEESGMQCFPYIFINRATRN